MKRIRTLLVGAILYWAWTQSGPAQLITDFESLTTPTASGTVLFRQPTFSGSTSAKLDTTPNDSIVESTGIPIGNPNSGLNTLRATFSFLDTDPVPLWLRFTTFGATTVPNPTVALGPGTSIQFDIYSDTPMFVAALIRETETGAAIGANGGSTGTIEFVGGTPSSASGTRGKSVTANTWTTLTFDFTSDSVSGFTGNGVLDPGTDSKGVLEALGLAFDPGTTGTINIWFDNLQVVAIPEPSSMVLGVVGGLGLTIMLMRRRHR
jgi:hypothetical protein